MRTFVRTSVTLAAALGFVAAAAAPAAALPGTCPGGEPLCIFVPAGAYPIGNPVGVGPAGQPVSYVQLPRVCDSTGTDCIETWVVVPGYYASSSGGTLATLNFPGMGVGIDGTAITLYASAPTVTPGGTGLGITVSVSEDQLPVLTNQFSRECENSGPTSLGPVTTQTTSCVTTVTLSA